MPVYRYQCNCGRSSEIFLQADKHSKVVACDNCGRGVNAKQVRDKSVTFHEKDGTIGAVRASRRAL